MSVVAEADFSCENNCNETSTPKDFLESSTLVEGIDLSESSHYDKSLQEINRNFKQSTPSSHRAKVLSAAIGIMESFMSQETSRPLGLEERLRQLQMEPVRRPLHTPNAESTRPYDALGRPPTDPIESPKPRFERGRRDDVVCYNPSDGSFTQLRNVLFRDYSREIGGDSNVQYAYYPTPYKVPIKTIMGHVEICNVLERSREEDDDNDDDDEEDDIVFQWTDRRVAVKVNSHATMERLRGRHAEDPLKEIATMQLIGSNHGNVLGCTEVLYTTNNLNIIMDYCDSGDLFQLLQDTQALNAKRENAPPGLSEGQARYWFRQIVEGVRYLHEECGICHRDLSPENVMIDQHKRAVVIDMGMCLRVPYQIERVESNNMTTVVQLTDVKYAKSQGAESVHKKSGELSSSLRRRRCLIKPQGTCGKLPYMSPEIYRNREPFDGEAADMWTLGTILFCMVTGNRSYQRPHMSDAQFYWMTVGLDKLLQDWGVKLSPDGVHLLKNLLKVDPRMRLTLEEVLTHPWFDYPDEAPHIPPAEGEDGVGGMDFDLDSDDDEDDD